MPLFVINVSDSLNVFTAIRRSLLTAIRRGARLVRALVGVGCTSSLALGYNISLIRFSSALTLY